MWPRLMWQHPCTISSLLDEDCTNAPNWPGKDGKNETQTKTKYRACACTHVAHIHAAPQQNEDHIFFNLAVVTES